MSGASPVLYLTRVRLFIGIWHSGVTFSVILSLLIKILYQELVVYMAKDSRRDHFANTSTHQTLCHERDVFI